MAGSNYGRFNRGGRTVDFCKFYGRMGNPRRVVSGLLTVIVRNQEGTNTTDWENGLDDFISKTEENTGSAQPEKFINQPPFWNPDVDASPFNYPKMSHFASAQGGYAEYENSEGIPWNNGWDRISNIGAKKAIGDYDCFLYHVTLACNLQEEVLAYSTEPYGLDTVALLPGLGLAPGTNGQIEFNSGSTNPATNHVYENVALFQANSVSAFATITLVFNNTYFNGIGNIDVYDIVISDIVYGGHFPPPINQFKIRFNFSSAGTTGDLSGATPAAQDIVFNINTLTDCMYEGAHTDTWINSQNATGSAPYDDYDAVGNPYGNALVDQDPSPFATQYGFPDNTDGEWYDVVDHKYCQSFVKWTLLSRHNNAYDHHDWSPYSRHLDLEGQSAGEKSELMWRHHNTGDGEIPESGGEIESMRDSYTPNDNFQSFTDEGTGGSKYGDYYKYGAPVSGKDASGQIPYPQGMIERDEYVMWVDDKQPLFGFYRADSGGANGEVGYPDEYPRDDSDPFSENWKGTSTQLDNSGHLDLRQGLAHRRKYVFNTGTSSYHVDSLGVDMSIYSTKHHPSPTGEADDPTMNMLTKSKYGYNRYFSPVHRIDIYASHPLPVETNTLIYDDYSDTGETLRKEVTLYKPTGGMTHDISFYNLVVNIQAISFNEDPDYPEEIDTDEEKVHFYNRTQVLFQAFGETSNIRLTLDEPTS